MEAFLVVVTDLAGALMQFEVRIDGQVRVVDVVQTVDGWTVRVDGGEPTPVNGGALGVGDWALSWKGQRSVAGVHIDGADVGIQMHGRQWRATAVDSRKAALQLGGGGDEGVVVTQMPGVVVRMLVAVGDPVEKGQPVIVVEAMKMENEFKATVAGVVTGVHVESGQAIETGTALVTVEPVG